MAFYNGSTEFEIFFHTVTTGIKKIILSVFIFARSIMGITKWKCLKKSRDRILCLQAHPSEISQDRWLSNLFLEIAMDRDYTASFVSLVPKRTSRLCLTVLFLSSTLPYNKQFINCSKYGMNLP